MTTAGKKKPNATRTEGSPFSKSTPGRLLHDAHLRMSAGLMQALRHEGHNLTTEGWAVLSLLTESDELSQLEISERVGKDRHHTSRLIDVLERQGLIVRKPSAEDRRVKRVALTEEGRRTRRKLLRVVASFIEDVFEGVPQRDFDAFIRVLTHVNARLPARGHRNGASPNDDRAPGVSTTGKAFRRARKWR